MTLWKSKEGKECIADVFERLDRFVVERTIASFELMT